MELPEKIKKPREVWTSAIMNITKKLNINVGERFNIDDSINAVKETDPELYRAYMHVINTHEAYSLYYHALKRNEPGTLEELQELEKNWEDAEIVLNKMVDHKASQLSNTVNTNDAALEKRTKTTIRKINDIINNCGISSPWLYPKFWHIGYSHTSNAFSNGEYGFFINIGIDLPQAKKVIAYFQDVIGFKEISYAGGRGENITTIFIEYKRVV